MEPRSSCQVLFECEGEPTHHLASQSLTNALNIERRFGPADRLGGVIESSRWWIWAIAAAAPVIVVVFVFETWDLNDETPAEWVFMGVMLFAWASSAAAGTVIAVALILRRWGTRGPEAVVGMLLSGTSGLLFAGAMLLAYLG